MAAKLCDIFTIVDSSLMINDNNASDTIDGKKDSLENVKNDVYNALSEKAPNTGSIEYANLNKMLAIFCLKAGNELQAVCHLIESHAVILRQQILHIAIKRQIKEEFSEVPVVQSLKPALTIFGKDSIYNGTVLKSRLSELPKEWYLVQITGQHEFSFSSSGSTCPQARMQPFHIAVLPTGPTDLDPLCITVPKPETTNSYDPCTELIKLLSTIKDDLSADYPNRGLYWKMREKLNDKLKEAISVLEHAWLREWRVLLVADPIDKEQVFQDLLNLLNKLILDCKAVDKVTFKMKWLLQKIICGACYLTREEIARAVKYVLPKDTKLADNLILSIYGKLSMIQQLKSVKRKTLVLIVDEHMDCIPFETLDILKDHPVTRFPSLHLAYSLFKEHENTIQDGCKIIQFKRDMGMCIVNPSGNLVKMEKRLKMFIDYCLPHWKSWYGVKPTEEFFEDGLVNHDILMYNGHGSGIQYLSGDNIQRLRVKSTVLLFGCSSVKLFDVGGRFPPHGISNQYLAASSPCVLGMLWEITDCDIDRVTSTFISSWIPSECEQPWSDVNLTEWLKGTLTFVKSNQKEVVPSAARESEMLRALVKSKDAAENLMTKAAIVVRGLPIKLVEQG